MKSLTFKKLSPIIISTFFLYSNQLIGYEKLFYILRKNETLSGILFRFWEDSIYGRKGQLRKSILFNSKLFKNDPAGNKVLPGEIIYFPLEKINGLAEFAKVLNTGEIIEENHIANEKYTIIKLLETDPKKPVQQVNKIIIEQKEKIPQTTSEPLCVKCMLPAHTEPCIPEKNSSLNVIKEIPPTVPVAPPVVAPQVIPPVVIPVEPVAAPVVPPVVPQVIPDASPELIKQSPSPALVVHKTQEPDPNIIDETFSDISALYSQNYLQVSSLVPSKNSQAQIGSLNSNTYSFIWSPHINEDLWAYLRIDKQFTKIFEPIGATLLNTNQTQTQNSIGLNYRAFERLTMESLFGVEEFIFFRGVSAKELTVEKVAVPYTQLGVQLSTSRAYKSVFGVRGAYRYHFPVKADNYSGTAGSGILLGALIERPFRDFLISAEANLTNDSFQFQETIFTQTQLYFSLGVSMKLPNN